MALVSKQASAHDGDATIVHECVNQANGEIRIAHPGPGNANTDCTALGPTWMNVHLDDEWLGAGTGSLSPANLTDRVGIGTASPNEALDVVGNVHATGSFIAGSINIDSGTLFVDSTKHTVGIGTTSAFSLLQVTDNSGSHAVRIDQVGTGHGLQIYVNTTSSDRFILRAVSNASGLAVMGDGSVGVGTITPSESFEVNGNALADAHLTPSSRRWKTNINTIDDALGTIQQLRGVLYDWKADGKHDLGLIAEEGGAVIPEVVQYEENGVDAISLDYARLVPLLIEAVKAQQASIEAQQQEIEALKATVATLTGSYLVVE